MPKESQDAVDAMERAVGRRLPEDYRRFMLTRGGMKQHFPNAYVEIWDLTTVEEVGTVRAELEPNEGLMVIGSDGASELIGFDLRRDPPPVVLVNAVPAGWREACFQATSFTKFLDEVAEDGFKFEGGYS